MPSNSIYSALLESVLEWKKNNSKQPLLLFVPNNVLKALAQKRLEGQMPEGIEVQTIPEFMRKKMKLRTPHPMALIWRLYEIHKTITSTRRDFSLFMSWGLQLLADFDEIDRYLLDPRLVFLNLDEYHRLESLRGSLPETVVGILKNFWKEFEDKKNLEGRSRFLEYWQHLPQLYDKLKRQTLKEVEAWDGLAMRLALEDEKKLLEGITEKALAFAGFSFVSTAEERFMSIATEKATTAFFYDINPDYLLQDKGALAEHGESLRRLMKKFPPTSALKLLSPSSKRIILQGFMGKEAMVQAMVQDIRSREKPILVVTPSQDTVQRLRAACGSMPDGYIPEADLSKDIDVVGFCTLLSELYEFYGLQQGYIHLDTFQKILSHPLILACCVGFENLTEKLFEQLKQSDTYYPLLKSESLITSFPGTSSILLGIDSITLVEYLKTVFTALTVKDEYKEVFKKIAEFFQALSVLNEELNDRRALMRLIQTWLRLEPIRSTDMPEPTRVMVTGLLDSRALDCQEIYFLDFNDGVFPATESKASIIPYTLRRAFGLPVMEHTLAEQLYLFFRLIQRPQIIHLYYNAQPDENHGGEPSLVLRLMEATLLHEWVSDYRPPHMPAPIIPDAEDIVVEKTPFIYAKLRQLLFEDSGLSATALNTYLACPLKFYFRYVADLKEPRNFSTWDPANFGTLFHIVMEKMYAPIVGQQDVWLQAEDLDHVKEKLPDVVKTSIAMVETGLPDKNFQLKGKSNLLERMLIKAAKTLVETDKKRAPFRILGTEKALQATLPTEQGNVKFRGKVDRIDETPECLVILDYKTGVSSWKQFDPSFLGDIFDEKKRSDYDVQLALYAWLLDKEVHGPRQISAQIYEVRSLLASNQDESITTAGPEHLYKHLPEFEEQLKRVVNAMLSPQVQFYQTSHLKTCSHCAYKNICRR